MRVGDLVRLPQGRFWWNNRVGVVSQVRMGGFSNDKGEHVEQEECKVDFGDGFIWYRSENMELLNAGR